MTCHLFHFFLNYRIPRPKVGVSLVVYIYMFSFGNHSGLHDIYIMWYLSLINIVNIFVYICDGFGIFEKRYLWYIWIACQAKPATLPHCLAYKLHPKYLGKKLTQSEKDIVLEFLSCTRPSFLQFVLSASMKHFMRKSPSIDSLMLLL